MAGEVFIARQDTLETVKGTVDGIDSGVKQANNALGNFSDGGTDTVKTELQTLKDSVAQLKQDVTSLKTIVEKLASAGAEPKVTILHINGQKITKTITVTKAAIVLYSLHKDYGNIKTVSDSPFIWIDRKETGGDLQAIQIVPAGTVVGISMSTSNDYYHSYATILEL